MQISYADKEVLNVNPDIPTNQKITDDDMNEIKNVVNNNQAEVGDLSDLETQNQSSIVDGINELVNGNALYSYTLVLNGASWTSGAWRNFTNSKTTDILSKGKYLILASASVTGASSGICSFRLSIDGSEPSTVYRGTVPVAHSLTSTGQATYLANFATSGTHTVAIQTYSSVNISSSIVPHLEIIRIGD